MTDYYPFSLTGSSLGDTNGLFLPTATRKALFGPPQYNDHPPDVEPQRCIVYVMVNGQLYVDIEMSLRSSNRNLKPEDILKKAREDHGSGIQPLGELEQIIVDKKRAAARERIAETPQSRHSAAISAFP
ncbi:TPA: hypothetical protein HA231_01130 [Candidatus Woesearchaeota archaeon]|nr:hypothetical protein [Candidatus Woesearchaeota archaeon]